MSENQSLGFLNRSDIKRSKVACTVTENGQVLGMLDLGL